MKKIIKFFRRNGLNVLWFTLASLAVVGLMFYRLGTLVPGLSPIERTGSTFIYQWHGLLDASFYMPLNFLHVLIYVVSGRYGDLLLRFPSALFGVISVGLFALLIKFWHGTRTAVLATALFACNAWLLHVSRLATPDILYLWAILLLLVVQLLMHKYGQKWLVFYGSMALCGLLLQLPGLVWFVLLSLFWQRAAIIRGWQQFNLWWQRSLYALSGLIFVPLLTRHLTNLPTFKAWIGLPQHFDIAQIGRQIIFVPIHLLVRGPLDSQRWLGHAPLLDIFSLAAVLAGIWFYIRHYDATRSRLLASYAVLGTLLVGLGGTVALSIMVPLLYIFAATGLAYLLHEWLQVFPINPIARKLGIGLVVAAVIVSCGYNIRAYFVAWPHDQTTLATFRSRN